MGVSMIPNNRPLTGYSIVSDIRRGENLVFFLCEPACTCSLHYFCLDPSHPRRTRKAQDNAAED